MVVAGQRIVKPSLARRIANLVFKSRYSRLDDSSIGYELTYRDNTEEPLIGPNFELFDPNARNNHRQGRSSGRRRRRRRRCCTGSSRKCVLSWQIY